jgi:hypothetical protein
MEGGEVEWNLGAEIRDDPGGEVGELGVGVVLPGDEERGDLQPDVGLTLQIDERLVAASISEKNASRAPSLM